MAEFGSAQPSLFYFFSQFRIRFLISFVLERCLVCKCCCVASIKGLIVPARNPTKRRNVGNKGSNILSKHLPQSLPRSAQAQTSVIAAVEMVLLYYNPEHSCSNIAHSCSNITHIRSDWLHCHTDWPHSNRELWHSCSKRTYSSSKGKYWHFATQLEKYSLVILTMNALEIVIGGCAQLLAKIKLFCKYIYILIY